MAKSKHRKKNKAGAGGGGSKAAPSAVKAGPSIYPAAKRRRDLLIFGAAVALIVGYLGFVFWQDRETAGEFDTLLAAAEGDLDGVQSYPNLGRRHLRPGEVHSYADIFPTSGPHEPTWVSPGLYDKTQRPTQLVHALEHGNIVIYYETPDPAVMSQLESWASLFTGAWDGVVVTPKSGLGGKVVMTAWRKKLELPTFDAPKAAAFIDAFRGRGPENPVR